MHHTLLLKPNNLSFIKRLRLPFGGINDTRLKIDDLSARINGIIKAAANYSEEVKDLAENMEINIFLPKLASELSAEVNNIVRVKENIKQLTGNFSPEKVREIAMEVFCVLREMDVVSSDIDEDTVVKIIMAKHTSAGKDPYAFLDDEDVDALVRLINSIAHNSFPRLNEQKQNCEIGISTLPDLKLQKQTLENGLVGGNEEIIREFESQQRRKADIETQIAEIIDAVKKLERRIHNFDIQIQQEPDVKFDTLVKLKPLFEDVANELLRRKREQIELEMQQQLNLLLLSYKGAIQRVVLSDNLENFYIKVYHKAGNEISLNQLNAASKQIFIQVLLKVLRNLGDYNPPVMIDTVMGVLDNESRDALMQEYFPQLAEQTILLCTTSEIRKDSDYRQLEAFISKTYTLVRDVEHQCTYVEEGYFGLPLNND